jgi:radical SAM superfamily enzyme YgiQ (UPF0313 family)
MKIFLADLGHNQVTYSSDVYPLGVTNLAAYTTAYLKTKAPFKISVFREPQDLKTALEDTPPDILGLSNYAWNHELSLQFARYAKALDPQVLVLMGGPNFPLTEDEQERYLRSMPEVDIAVRGPTYEGERAFLNIIQRYVDVGGALEGLQEEPVAGNMWIHHRYKEFVRGPEVDRILDLDEIPSPYLNGWMDPFFATGYFPLLQNARGCPFSCAFCNSSVKSNSKIYSHSLENVKADLKYIAERVRPEVPLCFADDNFAMYKLDEDVADYIAYLQDQYNWPQYIRTTTGKNRHERIIRVMRKTRGVMPMTSAVQSLNPIVLKNIKRSNIKLETYAAIQEELKSQGMQSYGELILSMPGETKESFMTAVEKLLDTGVKRVSAHQLMLLHGAPLNTPASRELWQFTTRFRVVARNIGNYLGTPAIETEEIVVETPTFSFADYLDARVFHLLLTIFYYEDNFQEAFELARQLGIKPFKLITTMQSIMDQAPRGFQKLIADFVHESQEELFETNEACIEWARENFDGLVDGSIGGNLLSKYSMLGRFYVLNDSLDLLKMGILTSLGDSLTEKQGLMVDTVIDYLKAVLLHAPFSTSLNEMPSWESEYDLQAWRDAGYATPLESHRLTKSINYSTIVEPKRKSLLEERVSTFGEHPAGLGKFTRTMFAQDLRRSVVATAA